MAFSTLGLALLTASVLASDGGSIRPCAPKSPEAKSAHRALSKLDREIRALDPDASTAAALRNLETLRQQRCFEGTRLLGRTFDSPTSTSLKTWWAAGGKAWFLSMLKLGDGSRTIVIPPDLRTTLVAAPGSALSAVVCPSGRACAEATGWRRRTQAALDAAWQEEFTDSRSPVRARDAEGCLRLSMDFTEFTSCLESMRGGRLTLPLGRIRTPDAGWLVIRYRHGHHGYCESVRVYSLATASAYVAEKCEGPPIRSRDRKSTRNTPDQMNKAGRSTVDGCPSRC